MAETSECQCLMKLDRLRLKHEEKPKETSFVVIEFDEKGCYAWSHNTNTRGRLLAINAVAELTEDNL